MGHSRLGQLPRTKRWAAVVQTVSAAAGVPRVAAAVLDAAERELGGAHKDVGVVEAVRLLLLLPVAARADDFAADLRGRGVAVDDCPGLMDVLGAVAARLDAATPGNRGRTDLGEMAQAALGESVAAVVGGRLNTLFGSAPADVHAAFRAFGTVKQFGALAHDFFSRLTAKFLDCYLSRTLPLHVGEGERFDTLADVRRFEGELDQHCRERAKIVERFSGDWLSKERWEAGDDVSPARAATFVCGAMAKLTDELRAAAGAA